MYSLCFKLFFVINMGFVLSQNACNRQDFTSDSFVCVCSESYCDFIGQITDPVGTEYVRVVSSRDEFRFNVSRGIEDAVPTGSITIAIDHTVDYQTMIGFGGTFHDSTGLNVVTLSQALQDTWIRSYFAPEGIEYDLARIPIGGSDFSTYPYTYDEVVGDVNLDFFALTQEDFEYKIPLMQRAIELSNRQIRFMGTPWSPPPWMKENGMHNGTGGLLREMWDPFSNYLVKFVQAYESYNITIWGLSPQNEPLSGLYNWPFNACAWSQEDMRDWIKTSFGPIFGAANLRRIKIMVLDDDRDVIPAYPATTFDDPEATQYVDGTAVHWYADQDIGPEVLVQLANSYPSKFILYTNACQGWDAPQDQRVLLGSWQRAENYAANIIEDVNNYVTGWIDSSMALDTIGGPNWVSNFVDSPTIIDADLQLFYKQPMFYALGHFSKFVKEGSVRMATTVQGDTEVKAAAFHAPAGTPELDTIILLNTGETSKEVSIETHDGGYINIQLAPKSIETILH